MLRFSQHANYAQTPTPTSPISAHTNTGCCCVRESNQRQAPKLISRIRAHTNTECHCVSESNRRGPAGVVCAVCANWRVLAEVLRYATHGHTLTPTPPIRAHTNTECHCVRESNRRGPAGVVRAVCARRQDGGNSGLDGTPAALECARVQAGTQAERCASLCVCVRVCPCCVRAIPV